MNPAEPSPTPNNQPIIIPNPPPTVSEPEQPNLNQPSTAPQEYAAPEVPTQPNPYSSPSISEPYTPSPSASPTQPAFMSTATPAVGQSANTFMQRPKNSKKKRFLALFALVPLLVVGSVFAFYLPNTPSNVWNTGLNRSGKALESVTNTLTSQQTMDTLAKTDFQATVDGKADGVSYNGTFNVKFDKTKTNGNLSVKAKSTDSDINVGLKFLSELKSDKTYPDVYLQYSGLKALGYDTFFPQIATYEGKWISIDSDYIASLVPADAQNSATQAKSEQLTATEISELTKAVASVNSQYVFSTDAKTAVFVNKGFVAKEKIDGTNTYHYNVGVDKSHAKDYCNALIDKVTLTAAYKKFPGYKESDNTQKDTAKKSCSDAINDDIKDDSKFDIWIDAKYKLIYKVRFYDKDNAKDYFDIGQNYKGGNEVSLFAALHNENDKIDGKFTLTTDIKSNNTKGDITIGSTKADDSFSFHAVITAKPLSGDVDTTKPAGAVPVKDILTQLGVDPSEFGGSGL